MASKHKIALKGLLWMSADDKNLGGHGRIELLSRIAEHGSITHAAKSMKMSYKAAWDAVDQMNNLAGQPLVERITGGRGGGLTRLTPRGERLIANFKLVESEHRRFIDELSRQTAGLQDDLLIIRRMNMKTSARNQFAGRVTKIRHGAVNDEIDIEIVGGQEIVAVITCESTEQLGVEVGKEVFALIKVSSVVIVTDEDAKFSARNRLNGIISSVQPGAVNSEVVIDLPGGGSVVSMVTHESAMALGLAVGKPASGIFKASSVIIGVPA